MNPQIGKLYKLNFDRILSNYSIISGSQYYAREESICLLLGFDLRKNNNMKYNKFKVLTEDGIIGWIATGMDAEALFSANIE